MGVPLGLRALAYRDFRLYWSGQFVSLIGRWMQSVGLAWLVLELTDSPLRLGLVGSLQFAPLLVLGVVSGALVDRFETRPLLVATQLLLMLPPLSLAALTWSGRVRFWHVAALAAVIGILNAFDMPARQSLVGELVARDDLVSAITLNSAMFNATRFVGPALAGLLIARHGPAVVFLVNGLSFLAVVAALLAMRAEAPPRAARRTSLLTDIGDGLRYARRGRTVSLVLSLVLVVSVFVINHSTLVPLFARNVLRAGAEEFGFLMASLGAGALTGAIALTLAGRGQPPLAAIVVPAVGVSGGILCLALVRDFWTASVVLFVVGVLQILFLAGSNTTLQVSVADEFRGRVMGLYTLVFAGVTPIGALFVGSAAESFGVPAACALGGGIGLFGVLALVLRRCLTQKV